MKLLGKVFWFAVFVAATFLWLVLFEHGPSGFQEGVGIEFRSLKENLLKPAEQKESPLAP